MRDASDDLDWVDDIVLDAFEPLPENRIEEILRAVVRDEPVPGISDTEPHVTEMTHGTQRAARSLRVRRRHVLLVAAAVTLVAGMTYASVTRGSQDVTSTAPARRTITTLPAAEIPPQVAPADPVGSIPATTTAVSSPYVADCSAANITGTFEFSPGITASSPVDQQVNGTLQVSSCTPSGGATVSLMGTFPEIAQSAFLRPPPEGHLVGTLNATVNWATGDPSAGSVEVRVFPGTGLAVNLRLLLTDGQFAPAHSNSFELPYWTTGATDLITSVSLSDGGFVIERSP